MELLGANIPGLGLAVSLGRFGIGAVKEKHERSQAISMSGALTTEYEKKNTIDDVVALISRLATPELPVIIIVEDLHKATDDLQEMLEKLLRQNSPILILSTTWPGEFERLALFSNLMADNSVGNRIKRVRNDAAMPRGFPKNASFDQLPASSLSKIVYNYYCLLYTSPSPRDRG